MWYKSAWPRMKAFALPSFFDGLIRINVKGREPHGIVEHADYERVCQKLIEELHRLTNARTGGPLVNKIWRTRRSPNDPHCLPDADLVVTFTEAPADVVDSPAVGRMGPFPFVRVGGHRNTGFLLARGPSIPVGKTMSDAELVDLPPTILQLMDVPVPDTFDGKPIFPMK
jgi:predicted AlkP superfamily phosphohydrolase/phosphomutase